MENFILILVTFFSGSVCTTRKKTGRVSTAKCSDGVCRCCSWPQRPHHFRKDKGRVGYEAAKHLGSHPCLEVLVEFGSQGSWVPVSTELGRWDLLEGLGHPCRLFTVLLTLQDGGCSCPGDVAKAFFFLMRGHIRRICRRG